MSENDVLSMFFDEDFVPHDFLDALFSSSLNRSNQKSLEFANARSLQTLQGRCSSLLTHLDYYTNELTRQFEGKMQDLENSSSIISYKKDVGALSSEEDVPNRSAVADSSLVKGSTNVATVDSGDDLYGITRLQYYIDNLSSALTSTARDLAESNQELSKLNKNRNEGSVEDLIQLTKIKQRIGQVIEVFDTVRSLVASGNLSADKSENGIILAPTGQHDDLDENASDLHLDVESFASAISLLKELILEQVSTERRNFQQGVSKDPKKDFVAIMQGMIDLEGFFRSMNGFYPEYKRFVQFLEKEKTRYLQLATSSDGS
ncbi:DEKNAAC104142 [Brettanomyces naardenensis]|uniref:DEKNAAC104142 n=1 Tax=Brettanomyces naardenensis TaxID=13370 RepID=A0A448YQE1_BRENA|nr:DEKNAAC104142 [Brettanomyces naardenensis]